MSQEVIVIENGILGSFVGATPRQSDSLQKLEKDATVEEFDYFRALPESEQIDILESGHFALMALRLNIKHMCSNEGEVEAIGGHAQSIAKEIQNIVEPQVDKQTQLNICLYPTEFCRTSMFFPMGKNEVAGDREFIQDRVITDNRWGRLTYTGVKLSVYDEDFLMALLVLINVQVNSTTVLEQGQFTYTYKGPILPILRATGVKGQPGDNHYVRFTESFKRMIVSAIDMEIGGNTTRGGKKKVQRNITNLITFFQLNEVTNEVVITVNPYFYEIYSANRFTNIDMHNRAILRKPTAKAIYRFVSSHQDKSWYGDVSILAEAINVDRSDKYEMKRTIANGIDELTKKGLFDKSSKLSDNYVSLTMAGSKPVTRKTLKAKTAKKRAPKKKTKV
jgi:hypothetical protein